MICVDLTIVPSFFVLCNSEIIRRDLNHTVVDNWDVVDHVTRDYCETVGRILKTRHVLLTSLGGISYKVFIDSVSNGSNKRTSTQIMNTTNQGRAMKPQHGLGIHAEFPVKMDVPKDQKCLGSNKIREVDISDDDILCMYTSKS